MKKFRLITIAILVMAFLAACTSVNGKQITMPAQVTEPAAKQFGTPQTELPPASVSNITAVPMGGPNLAPSPAERGPVYINSYEVLGADTADAIIVKISGDLPTSCSQFNVIADMSDASNRINLIAYTVEPSGQMCAQMMSPFEHQVTISGLRTGSYDIYLNDEFKETVKVPFNMTIQ